MIESVLGVIAGLAAHQADRVLKDWPTHWEYITRYIIGYLTAGLIFGLMLRRLNPDAMRDGVLSYGGAGMSVGIGVALARMYDEATK